MKEKDVIEADLTFQSISFAGAHGASDTQYEQLLHNMDSVLASSKEGTEEVKLYKYFDKLKGYGLLRKPYVFLRTESDSAIILYLTEKEYSKVKEFKHVDLYQEEKKVVLKLEIEELEDGIYYSENIIDVRKVNGRSRSNLSVVY